MAKRGAPPGGLLSLTSSSKHQQGSLPPDWLETGGGAAMASPPPEYNEIGDNHYSPRLKSLLLKCESDASVYFVCFYTLLPVFINIFCLMLLKVF
jgi:hypothetical protein